MKSDWGKGSYVFRGATQQDRYPRALMPENIRVDARELPAFLAFCARTAQLIRSVDKNNKPAGTWADFLEKDPVVLLALVMENRPEKWINEVRDIIRRFYLSAGEGRSDACRQLAGKVVEMAILLNRWYEHSSALLKWGADSPVNEILKKAAAGNMREGLRRLQGILTALRTEQLAETDPQWEQQLAALHPVWQLSAAPKTYVPEGAGPDDKRQSAVEDMRKIFQLLLFQMTLIGEKAPLWFRETLEKKQDHQPYIGLLLAYLQLFLHARDQMNTLPRRHLDYYYRELLLQKPRPQAPDRTIVCFQLADQTNQYRLKENALLLAGVNEKGVASHYATTEPVWLSAARIESLRTLFVSKSDMMKAGSSYKLVAGIYAAPVANSRDGLGAPFDGSDRSWPPFGEEQLVKNPGERQMTDAPAGFVIAAPILALREGEREIDLIFRFSEASLAILLDLIADISQNTGKTPEEVVPQLFSNALRIYATGVEGWFPVENWKTDSPANWRLERTITLMLKLHTDDPAVVDQTPESLGETFDTSWPLLKILLNPDHNIYLYSFTTPLELETLRIETRVKGVKTLTVMNEIGLLDHSAPFLPFGSVPGRNSYLLIGSRELFRKRLTELNIRLDWNNLPELDGGFAEYYREYNAGIDNHSFQVALSALSNYTFRPQDTAQRQTFTLFSAPAPDGKLQSHTLLDDIQLDTLQIRPDYDAPELTEYTNDTRCGYLKLQLCKSSIAFGHADFPRLFSRALIEQTKSGSGLFNLGGETAREIPLPRDPFAPVLDRLGIDYKAATTLNFIPLEYEENDRMAREKIMVIHPFGQQEIFADGKASDRFLFPRFAEDGYLYIGLSNAQPGLPLNLLFHLRESKHGTDSNNLQVFWSYLRDGQWEHFSQEELLYDQTRQFTTTGIISLRLPSDLPTTHKIMPAGLFWLRAAARGNLSIAGRVLDIQVNAVEAVWVDNGDLSHYDPGAVLPRITELVKPVPEIAAVVHPVPFTVARPPDQLPEFYARTSERLRHKNRAVTAWDIEHLVLEHFPNLQRVKCIGWMEYPGLAPGSIKVVVAPAPAGDDPEPRVGFHQLELIAGFLRERVSHFTDIQVINPVYEKIKVSCMVLLQKGFEHHKGQYLQLIQNELKAFICPWLHDGMIGLGGHISKNDVLAFLNNRPYIRFITRFSLVQIFEPDDESYALADTANANADAEILYASTPWSVLTPAQHNIRFIATEDHLLPEIAAIEDMRLGTDFIVVEGPDQADANEAGLKEHPDNNETPPEPEWYLIPESD
ncbi:MAG: hypothetical protein L6Q97_10210 [Thermoanaerobaculia bacterium]|nr:hypothetical protein [Thermoanaerobaculia bacterium]